MQELQLIRPPQGLDQIASKGSISVLAWRDLHLPDIDHGIHADMYREIETYGTGAESRTVSRIT